MKNKDTRRSNLLQLIGQYDSLKSFSEAVDLDSSYISQLKNEHREIGDNTAQKLEKMLNKPEGWLDIPHGGTSEDKGVYELISSQNPPIDIYDNGIPAEAFIRIMTIIDSGIGMNRFESYAAEEQIRIVNVLQTAILDAESKDLSDNFIVKMVDLK